MLFVATVKCLRHCGRSALEAIPVLLERLFCKQAGEKQGEAFYYGCIMDALYDTTRNSRPNDSFWGPALSSH